MAIQPIDLQTLFSQMDKVGKTQADQKEGAALQQSLQGVVNQRKVDERIRSVNETQDAGDGPERIKDRKRRGDRGAAGERPGKEGEETPDEAAGESEVVTDPALGRNIDVSG